MITHDVIQRSPEWHAVKCGKIGASQMSAVMAKGRGNSESKTRRTFMLNLLAERLSGISQNGYVNAAMEWGIENEPHARNAYEMESGNLVQEVGFVQLNEYVGCSPDGLVGDDGLVEIKCPNTATHIEYILDGRVPPEYVLQVQTQIWVTGRQWCDFVSFDPRVPCKSLFIVRADRDDCKITEIQQAVDAFIEEMIELQTKITGE